MFFKRYLYSSTHIFPLAVYRTAFGFLMCFSLIRFIANGWVETCYLEPEFHFTYQYFDWIQPFDSAIAMYGIISVCALAALCIGLGLFYRMATVVFFFSFTYLELIEKSWYLNHYYFVSIIAFLLCLIPAHKGYSLDSKWIRGLRSNSVASWTTFILKLQISIVYFFAGIAKLKPDWLFEAMPLKIWLKAKTDLPLIGELFQYETTAYLFSYFGVLYDLSIPFLLWNKRTRPYAFIAVVVFHSLTAILFNIGLFPWIMIAGSVIFITAEEWKELLKKTPINLSLAIKEQYFKLSNLKLIFLAVFFAIQVLLPLRHFLYNENILWTERNFRFGWNVMLMEKNGYSVFYVEDKETGKRWAEYPKNHLTMIQEKQMSFQPDMIWQYARFLEIKYKEKGYKDVSVTVDTYVTLNGRPSRQYLSGNLNLLAVDRDDIYDHVLEE